MIPLNHFVFLNVLTRRFLAVINNLIIHYIIHYMYIPILYTPLLYTFTCSILLYVVYYFTCSILRYTYTELDLYTGVIHNFTVLYNVQCTHPFILNYTYIYILKYTYLYSYLIFVISFTQAAFYNSKFYTQKLTKNTPKH